MESLFPGSNVDQNAAQETAAKFSANLDKIVIQGGQELHGKIAVSGAKNAALKFMCAALLTDKSVYLDNMPNSLRDINSQIALLKHLGCAVQQNANMMAMNAKSICTYEAPYDLVRKMRASILVLGPLLARFGEARVSLPGGCAIGTRAVDMHLDGLKAMGAEIELVDGYINAHVPENRLRAADIVFPKVSVGATENMMMAACLAEGTTTLTNAAREPEIVDLGECLIKMGARIEGLGTQVLKITGVEALVGAHHSVLPDRIEAGTYMIAAAMTGGCVRMQNVRADHLHVLIAALRKMGVSIEEEGADVIVIRDAAEPLQAMDIMTEPYPGFPTDLQAQFMALLTLCDGAAMVSETIFENRFMHVPELCRMGADIVTQGNAAIVRGVDSLKGAPVMATDLRASVALVLAGLVAEGKTTVNRIYHLERGYEDIVGKLGACGARIQRL